MKLAEAINDLLKRISDLLEEESYSSFMLDRLYRMKEEIVDPSVRALKGNPKFATSADTLTALYKAVEEYVVYFQTSPEGRAERRQKVEGLKSRVRRELLPTRDSEAETERLLDEIRKWQWKTNLDSEGRLVYSTASGAMIPARGTIADKVGPEVIQRAVKAQRPYSDKVRPRDARGEPGGLIIIEGGQRAIVVGDLHGRYDNLEQILKDKNNLQDILAGRAHLIFTGDAIHPRSSATESAQAYEDSFCVMLLIMTLKAENPFNIHYLLGNHDNAHVGGTHASRGQVRQDMRFKKFVSEKFGADVFDHYREFIRNSPVAAKVRTPNGWLIMVHACLSPRVLNDKGLINIFIPGRKGPALRDLLWSHRYEREVIEQCLANVGAKFVISGHTSPKAKRVAQYGFEILAEGVAAHVHDLDLVLSAQRNVFGYADVDMTRPLPEKVFEMTAMDGKPAVRILSRRQPAPGAAAGAASKPPADKPPESN
jgi:hypothetical protein